MTDNQTSDHHGSHRDLLWSGGPGESQPIDAIIVPTARPPAYLSDAAGLAAALGCTLVTLHSKRWTNAAKAVQRLPKSVDLIAIDIPDPAQLRLPRWETSRVLAGNVFRGQPARPRTDLSAKRNISLVLSRLLGWSRIMFLDDDITQLNPDHVRAASGLLDTHNAVGLHICGFHDHSVVCHAYRDAGGPQQSFIGGGALVVQTERSKSFFPEIYNDDWFFLLDGEKWLQPTAVTGRAVQYPYDPFRPDRARAEEFGDVLAEGIYWLLDQHLPIAEADRAHWTRFLVRRRQFVERVLDMVGHAPDLEAADRARRTEALKESLGRLALITPELCENYIRAWRADRAVWQRRIRNLPTGLDRASAISMLTRPGAPPLNSRLRRRVSSPRRPSYATVRVPGTGQLRLPEAHPREDALVGAEPACYAGSPSLL